MNNKTLNCFSFPEGPLQTNTYVVYSDNGDAAIIDPVFLSSEIMNKISKTNLSVKAVIATHSHIDHIHEIETAAKTFSAPVYMHGAAEKMREFYNESLEMLGFPYNKMIKDYTKCESLKTVDFGEGSLSIITTPGHSPCGLVLYSDSFIISGDLLFRGSIGRYDLPFGSLPLIYQSLKKISSLDEKLIVYPGHGPSSTLEVEKVENPYFKACC